MAVDTPAVSRAADPRARGLRRHQWLSVLGTAARTPRGAIGLALTFAKPSAQFPLGSDFLGRDVLSRVLNGGWILLVMAVSATAIGVAAGATAGMSAAYLRGRSDGVIMRTVDVVLAFPQIVFALLLLSMLGPKLWLIVLAVGVSHAPQVARVLRSATLDVSERDFVKVAELQGMPPTKILRKEILPNLISPIMVEAGLRLTYSIILISGLAFLGFGQAPPAPNWGYMVNENQVGLPLNPWAVIVPAALIALLTIGTNTLTDAIARVAIGVERRPEEAALVTDLGPEVAE
jgi:peptide/nickel transport system permease protein